MKDLVGLSHREMADIFSDWNRGVLDSFLIEITANIMKYKVRYDLTEKMAFFFHPHYLIGRRWPSISYKNPWFCRTKRHGKMDGNLRFRSRCTSNFNRRSCFCTVSKSIINHPQKKPHLFYDFTMVFSFLFSCLSSLQEERVRASGILNGPDKVCFIWFWTFVFTKKCMNLFSEKWCFGKQVRFHWENT